MNTYTIKTDAVQTEIEAASMDEAAREFAIEEGYRAKTVAELFAVFERIGDGAWIWIEGPEGRESYNC